MLMAGVRTMRIGNWIKRLVKSTLVIQRHRIFLVEYAESYFQGYADARAGLRYRRSPGIRIQ